MALIILGLDDVGTLLTWPCGGLAVGSSRIWFLHGSRRVDSPPQREFVVMVDIWQISRPLTG